MAETVNVAIARSNLRRTQQLLSAHIVALYTADAAASGLEVLLGAESIGELIDRLDARDRISNQDRVLVQQVTMFRRTMLKRQSELARARTLQGREVIKR